MTILRNQARALQSVKTASDCFQLLLTAATKKQAQVGMGLVESVDSKELEYMMDLLIEMVGGYISQHEQKKPTPVEIEIVCVDITTLARECQHRCR